MSLHALGKCVGNRSATKNFLFEIAKQPLHIIHMHVGHCYGA